MTPDLEGLQFCDRCGLSALLAPAKAARGEVAEIHLRTVPGVLDRLLRLFHADGAFSIEPPASKRNP
ncbi:hypothetical protein [Streptomyces sp. NPDC059708]|uniref:hypothetical protein n=1 Tax=Streptomyces sp. NPDC059708 TaxID=3346916 RepID=UPI0036A8C5E1